MIVSARSCYALRLLNGTISASGFEENDTCFAVSFQLQ